ncbi:serine hydrolase domain-containing protein [Lentzea aerocolonigenes]|uniref:serine hydrolase domain-containing protein n=1 Tax=Lentzea aerocolonigenes TaxID=68170 RepID=UPI0004C35FDB|nr:serine hydrolase domain-containing protein [Lentzea aerocolonigenes]
MTRTMYAQNLLDTLRAEHDVPGATLAVLVDGEIHEFASGVLNTGTGVEATTDSVFQLGSVAKIYTATLVMSLVDDGLLDLDARVVDVLPDFRVADPDATSKITVRQLLSHTSGLSGDFQPDTGRGDDCIEKYVEACVKLGQDVAPGATVSYSGAGYVVLGRIVEVLTGTTWNQALADRVLTPLGLTHTMTLPEEVLRFRAATGHFGGQPTPVWDMMPRAAGPAAAVCASAGDVVRLAKAHLDNAVLKPETVALMQERQVDVPDKWTVSADGWGLGWTLYDFTGTPGIGHDGAATGQYTYLRVIPEKGIAIALLTNGGGARPLSSAILRSLLGEFGVEMPPPFAPPAEPLDVDMTPYNGVYKREGVVIMIDGRKARYEFVDDMAIYPSMDMELVPVAPNVFAATGAGSSFQDDFMPVVFENGCCYIGMRAAPKVS